MIILSTNTTEKKTGINPWTFIPPLWSNTTSSMAHSGASSDSFTRASFARLCTTTLQDQGGNKNKFLGINKGTNLAILSTIVPRYERSLSLSAQAVTTEEQSDRTRLEKPTLSVTLSCRVDTNRRNSRPAFFSYSSPGDQTFPERMFYRFSFRLTHRAANTFHDLPFSKRGKDWSLSPTRPTNQHLNLRDAEHLLIIYLIIEHISEYLSDIWSFKKKKKFPTPQKNVASENS